MPSEHYRRLIWEGLLEADFRARYFGHLTGRIRSRERYLTILIGVLSSGAFVSFVLKLQVSLLPPALSLLSAIFSVVLASLKLGEGASVSASLYDKWSSLKDRYEFLWGELDGLSTEDAGRRWLELESEHKEADKLAVKEFRLDRKLAAACQADVLRARRLDEGLARAA